jgi:hypothetical protein
MSRIFRRTTNALVPVNAPHNVLDQPISDRVRVRAVPTRGLSCLDNIGSCVRRNRKIGADLVNELMTPEVLEPDSRLASRAQSTRSSSRVPPIETTRQVYDRAIADLYNPSRMVERGNRLLLLRQMRIDMGANIGPSPGLLLLNSKQVVEYQKLVKL